MFATACKAAQLYNLDQVSTSDLIKLSSKDLPDEYTLTTLDEVLLVDNEIQTLLDKFERILICEACLSHVERLQREAASKDEEKIRKLILKISQLILPNGNLFLSDEVSEAEKQRSLRLTCHIANIGLTCLIHLRALLKDSKSVLGNQVLLNILAFTSTSDPWTTSSSSTSAEHLLSLCSPQILESEFTINLVLSSFIRPLFSAASVPRTITASSRAAGPSKLPLAPHDFGAWSSASKPWRLDNCYALTLILWVVKNDSQANILGSFHLIIPPLLILLDSPNIPYRLKGLRIIIPFLQKLTPTLLRQTGLGSVIEDAIHPTLLYLPPITLAADSLSILPIAYEAFFVLLETRFPSSTAIDSKQHPIDQKERLACLTRLLRHVIIPSHRHTIVSSERSAAVQEVILAQLRILIRLLGTHSIRHLHVLIPLVSDILLDPFAKASLSTMSAAVKALREIILCAWPRIGTDERRRGITKIIVAAWEGLRNIKTSGESYEEAIEEVREELRITGKLFSTAVQSSGTVNLRRELKPLFELDESLYQVFAISPALTPESGEHFDASA